jgi:hypothetical protein
MSKAKDKPKSPAQYSPGPPPRTFMRWLKTTAPVKLKLTLADEEERMLVVLERDGRPRYLETSRAVEALGAVQVEGLSAEGETLNVWTFRAPAPPDPGYTPRDDDSEDQRLLKTFAHLLADSQREARAALVQVVELQSRHHVEDRKSFASILTSMDRAMGKMQRQVSRVRIATDDDAAADTEADGDSGFMEMIGPLIQKAVARHVSDGDDAPRRRARPPQDDPPREPTNGAASKE